MTDELKPHPWARCPCCLRPPATDEDRKRYAEGEGGHLCWGGCTFMEVPREELVATIDALRAEVERWSRLHAEAIDDAERSAMADMIVVLVVGALVAAGIAVGVRIRDG